jgi:hypothetical protein
MTKVKTLDTSMHYQAILKEIGRLGVLRVDNTSQGKNGKSVTLHERTAKEWFKEKFNPKTAAAARKATEEALISLIEATTFHSEQLVQNIRDRTQHGVDITGRAMARDYQPVERSQNPRPLEGGTVAARGKGNGVQILAAPAIKVRCDHAILRDATALPYAANHAQLLDSYRALSAWQSRAWESMKNGKRIDASEWVSQSTDVQHAAKSWTCIADMVLPPTGGGKAKLAESDVEKIIGFALQGKEGAVVLEPLPDQIVEKNGKTERTYTDEGLSAQLRAARQATIDAKAAQRNLVVSFACENEEVLNRLKSRWNEKDKATASVRS